MPDDLPAVNRNCPMCGGSQLRVHFTYSKPPPLEFQFEYTRGHSYWRELHRCKQCGHYYEWHEMDQSKLYDKDYVTATYGDEAGIHAAFNKINTLPLEYSDNMGRVKYIINAVRKLFDSKRFKNRLPKLLDVGSGLGVFPYRMKKEGWDITALDMDDRLVNHACDIIKIKAFNDDVVTASGLGKFDLITFNKVLEHIENPISVLSSVSRLLLPGGVVYVELPDGEAAEVEGKEREEYLLGHVHVFSAVSYALLAMRAAFSLITFERLREPSGKFTLRGFMKTWI